MKVKCIKTSYIVAYPDDNYGEIELYDYITVDKIYETLHNSECEWNILDDHGKERGIGKECFIPIRDINLNNLLETSL